MFLEIDSEMLVCLLVDGDLESLSNVFLELLDVFYMSCGNEGVIHVDPDIYLPRGIDDLVEQAWIIDGTQVFFSIRCVE